MRGRVPRFKGLRKNRPECRSCSCASPTRWAVSLLLVLFLGAPACSRAVSSLATRSARRVGGSRRSLSGAGVSLGARSVAPEAYYQALLSELFALRGQPSAALAHVRGAIEEDPDSVWLRLREANLLLFVGRERRARQVLLQVSRSRPRRVEGWLALATLDARQDPARALEWVLRALSLSPHHVASRLLQARLLRRLGRYTRAARALRGILSDHPNHAQAMAGLGYLALERGQLAKAKTWFARWTQAAPFQVPPWSQLARTAVLLGDLRGAEQTLMEGLTATGDDLELAREALRLWWLLGRRDRAADLVALLGAHETGRVAVFVAEVLLRLGRWAQARGWLGKAAVLDPEASARAQTEARWLWRCGRRREALVRLESVGEGTEAFGWVENLRASYLEVLAGPHRAMEEIRSALRRRPRDPLLWQDLAERLAQSGRLAPALRALGRSRALRALGWQDVGVRYERVMLTLQAGGILEAKEEIAGLVTDAPDDPAVLNLAGYSLLEREIDLPRAGRLLERAYRLSPLDPYVLDSLGWLRYKQGRLGAAVRWLGRATRIDPWLWAAWRHLGRAQIARGRPDLAQRAFASALVSAPSRAERSVSAGVLERLPGGASISTPRWRCPPRGAFARKGDRQRLRAPSVRRRRHRP